MLLYSNTLEELVRLVYELATGKELVCGTATGGTVSTLVDSTRYEIDDYFQFLTELWEPALTYMPINAYIWRLY